MWQKWLYAKYFGTVTKLNICSFAISMGLRLHNRIPHSILHGPFTFNKTFSILYLYTNFHIPCSMQSKAKQSKHIHIVLHFISFCHFFFLSLFVCFLFYVCFSYELECILNSKQHSDKVAFTRSKWKSNALR